MSGYQIAAIPTVYRGRRYRSRLEARWAAFFDELGWRHEYEPFDLDGWVPDFALWPFQSSQMSALVEVKPFDRLDPAIWARIVTSFHRVESDYSGLILTRSAPQIIVPPSAVSIGWFHCAPDPTAIPPKAIIAWQHKGASLFWWRAEDEELTPHLVVAARLTMDKWAEATNFVQWQGASP